MSDGQVLLDLGKASAASPKLRLGNIVVLGLEAKALSPYAGQTPLTFHLVHHEALWKLLDDALTCIFAVTVKIRHKSGDSVSELCEVSVRLRSEYDFAPEFVRESDEVLVNDYVGVVGRLHAWPYFRAEVQQLTAKLGFPPLTLPTLVSGNMVTLKTTRFLGDPEPGHAEAPPARPRRSRKAKKS